MRRIRFRQGETGKIQMSAPLKNVLVIPQKATFDVLDKKFVYVLGEDNEVHARTIKIRAEMPHVYVVESGLSEHDKILVEGLRKVRDGTRIDPQFKAPAEVLAHLEVPAE